MSRVTHLVSRFFGSLRPRDVDGETLVWVVETLTPGELHVWEGLTRADRAESVAVAQRFNAALAGTPDATNAAEPDWIAAALLHDVGKQTSSYGPVGRAVVTVMVMVAGGKRVRSWADEVSPSRSRMGRYAAHDEQGAELLELAAARPEATAWAAAHHRPDRWDGTGIPEEVCRALARADGEPGL